MYKPRFLCGVASLGCFWAVPVTDQNLIQRVKSHHLVCSDVIVVVVVVETRKEAGSW